MNFEYRPKGVCSSRINFSIEDGKVHQVLFTGGCNGNSKGLSAMVEGVDAKEVIQRLQGIRCGSKGTSCPDQLSKALEEALNNTNN